ncbi:hypothetical protein [uncultured Bacteroides sp.]|uniref:hypothetical protein n=1 Tax=uncultured Bacteroides sp. TaxID=162156 RepID=UPI0026384FAD|nr:hypothetical protein [uncultured Bacteroides sp.]
MEAKKETIQIETFFKYAEEGVNKKLESIERLVRVDGEVVQRQQMNPLMYRLDNSPIQQFLSWVKGDGSRIDSTPHDLSKYAGTNTGPQTQPRRSHYPVLAYDQTTKQGFERRLNLMKRQIEDLTSALNAMIKQVDGAHFVHNTRPHIGNK